MAGSVFYNKRLANNKNKGIKNLVFFFTALIFVMAANYNCPDYLDLNRYYVLVHSNFTSSDGLVDVITWSFLWNRDFIYFALFWLFEQSFLGASFLTGLTCSLYYYIVLRQFSVNISKSTSYSIFILFGLFCFPNIIWLFSIPRNLTAYLFFFCGILLWFKGKKTFSFLLFVITIFTHISCALQVSIFYITVFLYNIWLKNKPVLVRTLCYVLPLLSYIFTVTILNNFITSDFLSSSLGEMRYTRDGEIGTMSAGAFDSLGYGDASVIIFTMVSIYLLLVVDRHVSLKKVLFLVFGSITIGLSSGSQVFMMRFMMGIPFFYALYMGELYSYYNQDSYMANKKNVRDIIFLNSSLSIMGFALLIYAYRFWQLL